MKLRFQLACALAVAGLVFTACSSGGSGSGPTFNLEFDAPAGSGLASGDVNRGFAPVVIQDFDLPPGIAVTGQVWAGDTVTPLQNVTVSFRRTATSPDLDTDTTDAGGNYSVVVPSGTWVVVLESADATLGTMTVTGVSVTAPGPDVEDFQFDSTVIISGAVEDDGATGIVGADLDFTGTTTGANDSVTTIANGAYTVSLVPDTYDVVVTPNDATHLKQRFSVVVTAPTIQNFTLTRGITVSGVVQTNLLVPLQDDADIEVELPESSAYFAPDDVTANDVTGFYSIDLVPPGTVIFEIEPSGDTGFPRQRITRTISGPTAQTVNFPLAIGVIVNGTIWRNGGVGVTPEANVEVKPIPTNGSLPPDDDDTDAAGFFEISLFPGTYNVEFTPETTNLQLPEVQTFTVGNVNLPGQDLELTLGVVLTGTVTEPGGVNPAPDIRVEIPNIFKASDVTDGAGMYSFLAPIGTHTLDLTAEDGPFEDIMLDSVANVIVPAGGPVDITLSVSITGASACSDLVVLGPSLLNRCL